MKKSAPLRLLADPVEPLVTPTPEIGSNRLAELETIIEKGLQTFMEVGSALFEIRDSRLYRNTHDSFESYLRERWNMSRQRAYQLIEASEVARNLSTVVDTLPTNERQMRPLAGLEPDQQRDAWGEATKDNPSPTAKQVAAAVAVTVKDPEPEAEPSDEQPVAPSIEEPPPETKAADLEVLRKRALPSEKVPAKPKQVPGLEGELVNEQTPFEAEPPESWELREASSKLCDLLREEFNSILERAKQLEFQDQEHLCGYMRRKSSFRDWVSQNA
jgi:hypothetical protein